MIRTAPRSRSVLEHIGSVGERVVLDVTVALVRDYMAPKFAADDRATEQERVFFIVMRDDAGRSLVTRSRSFKAIAGARITIAATVTSHEQFRGIPQTHVKRVRLVAVRDGVTA